APFAALRAGSSRRSALRTTLPEPKPHPRLLSNDPPHLEIGERHEHLPGIPAPGRDEGVDVPGLRAHRVPEGPLDGIEVRGRGPLDLHRFTLPVSLFPPAGGGIAPRQPDLLEDVPRGQRGRGALLDEFVAPLRRGTGDRTGDS